jgi:phosphoribosylanthranilate isomerase
MFVKICGLTDERAVEAAVEAGADALGFVFAESVREVAPKRARALCLSVPRETLKVAVMRHPDPDRLASVLEDFAPDWIQTDFEDFDSLPAIDGAEKLPVYREGETPELTALPPRLLFEGRISGSGTIADWDEARRLAARTEVILAGGLNTENVNVAIAHVRPFGVDVSSGVESARGRKDPSKIREFVARVRAGEINDEQDD